MRHSGLRAKRSAAVCLWLGLSTLALAVMSACVGVGVALCRRPDDPIGGPSLGTSTGASTSSLLLGDWNGARTRLLNAGIDFRSSATPSAKSRWQCSGRGDRRQVAYTDQWVFGTRVRSDQAGRGARRHHPGHVDGPQRQQSRR